MTIHTLAPASVDGSLEGRCIPVLGKNDRLFRARPFSARISRWISSTSVLPVAADPFGPRTSNPSEYVWVVMYPVKFARTCRVRCAGRSGATSGLESRGADALRGRAACKVSRATIKGGGGDIGGGTYVQKSREGCSGVEEEGEDFGEVDVNRGDSLSVCQRSFCVTR
jgi:hypothetical protein